MSDLSPIPQRFTRRAATRLLGGALLAQLPAARLASALDPAPRPPRRQAPSRQLPNLRQSPAYAFEPTPEDIAFLNDFERRACLFFVEQADPASGQVLDRAVNHTTTGKLDIRFASSIASTGFGLSALCIADKHGFFPTERLRHQVLNTLKFHLNKMPNEHGFFYHFSDVKTGKPLINSEVSSIDTAIFLCGVLTARAHFNDPQIHKLATQIYERVDFPWMLNNGLTFSMGWHPENGFISYRWNEYSELMMLYLLAIGSPTNPVDPDYWDHFTRPHIDFANFRFIGSRNPLFIHQYSHAWFDFANKRDDYADYFTNSVTATRAHKAFCLSLGRGYSDNYWGVTASDWLHGYTAWGGPPLIGPVDGTIVPCAAAGSLPFLPAECLRVLRSLKDTYGKDAWGRYGLCDAFHPKQMWYDPDVLGIDLGIGLLMAENMRSGYVWDTFMLNPEPNAAMSAVNFHTV